MKVKKIIKKVIKKLKSNYLTKCSYKKIYNKCKINDKVILLESQQGKEYNGNIYYIAKELLQNEQYKDFKIYMSILKDKKEQAIKFFKNKNINRLEFVNMGSREYFKVISTAKYLINDNTFLPFWVKKDGQVYLNTWHGTPLKSLGKKIKNDLHNIGNAQRNFVLSDYLLYPNEYTRDHMIEDYMIGNLYNNKIILGGYPRNTAFFDEKLKNDIIKKYNLQDKQIIAYMPTWRGTLSGQNSSVQEANLRYIFEEMEERLSDNQIFYVNLHPIEKATADFSKYKKVKPFPAEYETYEFLNIADVLVTDYSSVFYDFMNTRKKIILYTYDKESYLEDRGLYMQLEELPFPKVDRVKDLVEEINKDKNYDDTQALKEFCNYDNINATKELCKAVILNKKTNLDIKKHQGNGKDNIMIFGGKLAMNGITTSLKNLIRSLDKEKNNYYLIVESNAVKENLDQLQEISELIEYIPTKGKMNLSLLQKIWFLLYKKKIIKTKLYLNLTNDAFELEAKRLFGNYKINSLIQFSGYSYKKILLFSKLKCNKVIYTHSDMYSEAVIKKNIKLDVLQYAYNNYDKIAVVSEDLEESIMKIADMKDKLYFAHNIINYKRILELSNKDIQFDEKTEATVNLEEFTDILNSKNKKIITIGRFSKEKGHERLINAFERIWNKDNSLYLIIIGGYGKEYKNILKKAQNSICSNNIIIIKYVSNPYAILNKCDYFILPSLYEGFGLVLAEADILGKPVVATNIVGPATFMKAHNGTLVEDSEEGVYNGLEMLLENKIGPMNIDYEEYNNNAIKEFEELLK